MLDVLMAVVLASFGLAIVGYLGNLLWQAAFGPLSGIVDRRRLARCESLVSRGDIALRQGKTSAALQAFVAALCVFPVRSAAAAAAVDRHHVGLLSRFIAASDRHSGGNLGSLSLATADRLLRQRKRLQSAYIAALQTGEQRRRREIEAELRANARELRKAVTALAREIATRQPASQMH